MLHVEETSAQSQPLAPEFDQPAASESRVPTPTDGDAPEHLTPDALQALQNRDPAAVKRWIYGERALLYGFLLKIVKDKSTARELLQETFFQALRAVPSFRGEAKVSTWLCSIARNLAYEHFRNQKRYVTAESETLDYLDYATSDTASSSLHSHPHSYTERSERKEMVHAALSEMSTSYRQIIRLRDLQEHSTQEVADELDLTPVNVRVRLHRARKRLKRLLTPQLTADYRLAV